MLRRALPIFALAFGLAVVGQHIDRLAPATQRHSTDDLEVLTLASDGHQRSTVFLSRAFLATLPQIAFTLKQDENFPELQAEGAKVTGIELGDLLKAIAPDEPNSAAVAVCRDGYTSPFPSSAIHASKPILILTVNGLTPHAWATKNGIYDPSPFFITYQHFVPNGHILAHEDHAQHPAEIIQLKILPDALLFAAITPTHLKTIEADSPVLAGFRIAQQNCFRCHNSGETGGTKAGRSWQRLSQSAETRPDFFAAWIHNPQSIDPKAEMPPNLKYDQATLTALTRYFQTFAPAK